MTAVLPEKILRLVPPNERAKLGKMGLLAEECLAKAEIKNEKQLQKLLINYLRQKGIEPISQRLDRRTTTKCGTPDILFAVFVDGEVTACAWEVKVETGRLSLEQEQMGLRLCMAPNGWRWRIIRSFDQAKKELEELGL